MSRDRPPAGETNPGLPFAIGRETVAAFAWEKLGLIFRTARDGVGSWMNNSALTPTPYRLSSEVVRIFAGFRDAQGVSRIGYVDVLAADPTRIVAVSREPVLDIGRDGCFDDNGVILGDVIAAGGTVYLFYVGFQLVAKAKFLAFSGLAQSVDGANSFRRVSEAPLLDRAAGQTTIAAIHSVLYEQGRWRIWYACGDDWEEIDGRPYPRYHIRYLEGGDLLALPRQGTICLQPQGTEYRIGRPRVYRIGDRYVMYFTKGTIAGDYSPGLAYSANGLDWVRQDADAGIAPSRSGWDSLALSYPALIELGDSTLMVYNGNNMGVEGFGAARAPGLLAHACGRRNACS